MNPTKTGRELMWSGRVSKFQLNMWHTKSVILHSYHGSILMAKMTGVPGVKYHIPVVSSTPPKCICKSNYHMMATTLVLSNIKKNAINNIPFFLFFNYIIIRMFDMDNMN